MYNKATHEMLVKLTSVLTIKFYSITWKLCSEWKMKNLSLMPLKCCGLRKRVFKMIQQNQNGSNIDKMMSVFYIE